jgi:hypothetical protein
MEYWSVGVPGKSFFQYSNTPLLHCFTLSRRTLRLAQGEYQIGPSTSSEHAILRCIPNWTGIGPLLRDH